MKFSPSKGRKQMFALRLKPVTLAVLRDQSRKQRLPVTWLVESAVRLAYPSKRWGD